MANVTFSWDTIGPFFVWQFLIPLAAGWIQSILYSIFIRAGDPKPTPGTLRFVRHRRQILICIYAAYFAFTIYEVDFNLQKSSNAYNDLGLPIDVDENALQKRFRKLTIMYHPDKVKGGERERERASAFYVHLKDMRDIVLDPAKRFAYDRFGPDIFRQCTKCVTVKEYVDNSLLTAVGTYGVLLVMMVGSNALGFWKDGAYWRYVAILAVAVLDMRTAMRPDHPSFLTKWLNPLVTSWNLRPAYLPFQVTIIAKKASISAAQFLGLLIPLYRDDPQKPAKAADDSEQERHKQIDRLEEMINHSNADATRLLELESTPFKENEQAKSELREALKKYMVQNVVHQEKDVRNAIGQSIARRRAGAPHGAIGTK
ncbi:hypothetical protein CC80DRAFT_594466 [Byssothecium circinans]|uniref:J domain-containing protein n=1 Tax=Byssothecium circinans TaxID=147558 RepID=A0A6A5TU61_9PLEO|nr:hypothetical protein CC80DRAFT_594466 [Byssothecium circinans]